MIANLQPYRDYKDSGLPWLGQIPTSWEAPRTKTRFRLSIEKSGKSHGKELLSLYTHIGVRPRKDLEQRGNKATSTDGYWGVQKGDIVVNKLLAWMGAVAVSHFDGVTSPAYDILRPIKPLESDYYHYLFRTKLYLGLFRANSRGIMDMRLRLYFDQLGQIPLLCPPREEQAAIVRFLDWANGRLERAIRAKRKVISLLQEQKQAIIHRAVTRGLDPNAPLKPTGIPWLGDIPVHWDARRLRFCISGKLSYGANEAASFDNPDWPRYLRITDFRSDGTLKADTFRSLPPHIARDYPVQNGDLLFARSGATVGKAFLVRTDTEHACYAGYLIRARPRQGLLDSEFLFAYTQSFAFARWKDEIFSKATIQNIGADKYANLVVPLPGVEEQKAILARIASESRPLKNVIDQMAREITLLREFQTRLVTDVVTGKCDIRDVARNLPVESIGKEVEPERDNFAESDSEDVEL